MAAIASLVQPINRRAAARNQKERLKNEQNIECRYARQGGSYAAGSSQRLTTVLSAKPEQALEQIQHLCSNWLKVKGQGRELGGQAVTPNKSGFEQASFNCKRKCSPKGDREKLNQLL